MTPPPAIVALMSESSSSSPRMASCKWRGVMRFTFRSLDAFPASSSTSAVRYSRMAALYTAAVAPTRPWLVVLDFRRRWMRPTGNCRPALCERETPFVLALPESFPAFPPAIPNSAQTQALTQWNQPGQHSGRPTTLSPPQDSNYWTIVSLTIQTIHTSLQGTLWGLNVSDFKLLNILFVTDYHCYLGKKQSKQCLGEVMLCWYFGHRFASGNSTLFEVKEFICLLFDGVQS